jgi:hypothetical protein
MSARLRRVCDAVTALCAAAALALVVWPATPRIDGGTADGARSTSIAEQASAGTEPGASVSMAADEGSPVLVTVRGNLFSASRRTPTSRFTPGNVGESGSGFTAAMMPSNAFAASMTGAPAGSDAVGTSAGGPSDAVPALFGIVSVDGVRRALLVLQAGDVPRLFGVGESQAGYRITAIEADRIVLVSAAGSRTLRLMPRASRDSSENMP